MKARHPVFTPFSTPAYSNAAFRILGYVIESITNMPYGESLDRSILGPLEMTHTYATKPEDSTGAVPSENSGWAMNIGDDTP